MRWNVGVDITSGPPRRDIAVRPATPSDDDPALPGLRPDHWRASGNPRSFVAVDATGRVLGHCRGVDNVFHPQSRSLVLACTGEGWDAGVADALLAAQIEASSLPLRMKLTPSALREVELAERFDAVVEQVCPPGRRVVGATLRAWASRHRGATAAAMEGDADELRELWIDHYIDQHAAWSPAATRAVLLDELHDDFVPGTAGCFDIDRSVVLRRDGVIVAAAIVWPDDEPEVTLVARPHRGAASVRDRQACLSSLIEASADGDVLLLDAHLTERDEYAMMRGVPGVDPDAECCALVAVLVPDGPVPCPLDQRLVPEEVLTTTLGILWPACRPVPWH